MLWIGRRQCAQGAVQQSRFPERRALGEHSKSGGVEQDLRGHGHGHAGLIHLALPDGQTTSKGNP